MHGCGSRAATSRAGTRSMQTACQRLSHPRLDSIFGRSVHQAEEPARVRPAAHRHRHRCVSRSVPPTSAFAGRDGCLRGSGPVPTSTVVGRRPVRHPVRHLRDTPPSSPGNRGGVRIPLRPLIGFAEGSKGSQHLAEGRRAQGVEFRTARGCQRVRLGAAPHFAPSPLGHAGLCASGIAKPLRRHCARATMRPDGRGTLHRRLLVAPWTVKVSQ